MPHLTPRTGCLGAAWGVGLLLFVGGIDGLLQGSQNVRLSGPAYQAEANDLVRSVIVELVLTLLLTAGVALWRRRWFPTLATGASIMCIIGILDIIFIGMASAPF
jgi:MFS superfamily sulfate permease-like transporter